MLDRKTSFLPAKDSIYCKVGKDKEIKDLIKKNTQATVNPENPTLLDLYQEKFLYLFSKKK